MGSPFDNARTNWWFPFDSVHSTLHQSWHYWETPSSKILLKPHYHTSEYWPVSSVKSFPSDNLLQETLSSIKCTIIYTLLQKTLFSFPAVLGTRWPFKIASPAQSQTKQWMAMRHARSVQRPHLGNRTLPTDETLDGSVWPSFRAMYSRQQALLVLFLLSRGSRLTAHAHLTPPTAGFFMTDYDFFYDFRGYLAWWLPHQQCADCSFCICDYFSSS